MSLRKDVMYSLLARCGEALPWVLPAMTPADVLDTLNLAGPSLDAQALPVIEAVLEGMFVDGLVGRIPPPVVGGAASYVPREAAERELPGGKPVMLLPLRGGRTGGPNRPTSERAVGQPAETNHAGGERDADGHRTHT